MNILRIQHLLSLVKDVSPGSKSVRRAVLYWRIWLGQQTICWWESDRIEAQLQKFDLLLRYQASSYCSREKPWRRAQDIELELLSRGQQTMACYQANSVSVCLCCMHLLLSPCRPLSYRRHHSFHNHASARCTCISSRLHARALPHSHKHMMHVCTLTIEHASLAPDGQANSA